MANIPTPDVAKGTAVGAKEGLSASEFHSGPFHDIRDFGAAMDGSTDDSAAIMDALRKSASDGGAAYIPKGTSYVQGYGAVKMSSKMDGATLVGDGADSVLTGNKTMIGFFDSSHNDVTLANFRIDVTNGDWGIRTPNEGNNPGTFTNITFDNLWVHGAGNNNVKFEPLGTGDNVIAEMRNLSVWNSTKFHGMGIGNHEGTIHISNLLAWNNGNREGEGYGIDVGGEGVVLDGFILVGNMRGTKTTYDNVRTEYRNGAILNNRINGYNTAPDATGEVVFDNVLSRANGGEGFSLGYSSVTVPTKIWAVDNAKNPTASHHEGGVEYHHGVEIDANQMQVYGTENGSGVVQRGSDSATGTVTELVAAENSDGTFGNRANVSYDTVKNESATVPPVEEIVGKSTDSAGPSVQYHDGNGWRDATMQYYDGDQFTDVSIKQPGSN